MTFLVYVLSAPFSPCLSSILVDHPTAQGTSDVCAPATSTCEKTFATLQLKHQISEFYFITWMINETIIVDKV